MKMTIEMPQVQQCAVSDCSYNQAQTCHARAITVGGAQDHLCDTMFNAAEHTSRSETAGVGACKTRACTHNVDLECQAEQIEIGLTGGQASCMTFAPRA